MKNRHSSWVLVAVLAVMSTTTLRAEEKSTDHQTAPLDFTEYSIEDLMNMEVTSVTKTPQKLSGSAAAITVITAEDIRRSGATSVADLLRRVPGLQVAQFSANHWSITSRIFNEGYPKTMLALVDGRSIYSPFVAGVSWETEDVMLEDVERIEIIRGPGASLWGANAVNGVINVVTKSSENTQGGLVSVGAGNEEKRFGSVRYGGRISDQTTYRAYFKYFDRDSSGDTGDSKANDAWDMTRGGFRMDSHPSMNDDVTLQGDIYDGTIAQTLHLPIVVPPFAQPVEDDVKISGGNAIGRWSHTISDTSDMILQLYYDRSERNSIFYDEYRDTVDFDFQHRFELMPRNEVLWGAGYRYYSDKVGDGPSVVVNPTTAELYLLSAFVQDEISIVEDRLKLTVGSKFEDHYYSGYQVQPSARISWTPTERQTIWSAVSRAIRTPSRAERDVNADIVAFPLDDTTVGLVTINGNDNFDPEEVTAYELGYRVQPADALLLDVATFYNDYNNLQTFEPDQPFFSPDPAPHLVLPTHLGNELDGEIYGAEAEATIEATENWRLVAGYTFVKINLHHKLGSLDERQEQDEGESPQNQIHLRSMLDLPANVEFDTSLYYVDELERTDEATGRIEVPRYVRVDLRLGWRATDSLEASIVAQNVLDPQHQEFGDESTGGVEPTQIERSIYGKLTWRF